ncbi:MAG: biotin operon repressor, partial [Mucispirillum sp.]|nr:biotin operon repressor [Mucispirillum sp.]
MSTTIITYRLTISFFFRKIIKKELFMAVKDKVLEILSENRGAFVSGENLSDKLKVSRSAIWKAVESLRNAGYKINAVTNKGYALERGGAFSKDAVEKYL